MTGLELIAKFAPVTALCLGAVLMIGQMKADVANLKEQVNHITAQIDKIADKMDAKR